MDKQPHGLDELIRTIELLGRHEVDFVVVGGVAAFLEGAEITTEDLDIVFDHNPENNTRLLAALKDLGAHYKDPAGRYIEPDALKIAEMRIHLLRTRQGDIDALTRIGDNLDYKSLVDKSHEYELSDFPVRVLGLETVIATKEYANRPKDRKILPYLRRFLQSNKT